MKDRIEQYSGLITNTIMTVSEIPSKDTKGPESINTSYTNTSCFYLISECRICKGLEHFQRACNWNGFGQIKFSNQFQLCNQNSHIAQLCINLESYA